MEIVLEKKPKKAVIIEGFPGFGLVATITTEFLIEHLGAKRIGEIKIREIPPMIAVHDSKVVEPLGIFYDKKSNIIIIHALASVAGHEWEISETIAKLAKQINAKEVLCIEGVAAISSTTESEAYYVSNISNIDEKLKKAGIKPLKEGIIMGVTGALMLRKDVPISSIFAETHSALPDSRAAAKIIEALDKYLGLKVDYKPLLQKAEEFEEKVKHILEKTKDAKFEKDKKELSYLG